MPAVARRLTFVAIPLIALWVYTNFRGVEVTARAYSLQLDGGGIYVGPAGDLLGERTHLDTYPTSPDFCTEREAGTTIQRWKPLRVLHADAGRTVVVAAWCRLRWRSCRTSSASCAATAANRPLPRPAADHARRLRPNPGAARGRRPVDRRVTLGDLIAG
jgi:hypothetical protein